MNYLLLWTRFWTRSSLIYGPNMNYLSYIINDALCYDVDGVEICTQ